MSTSFRTLTTKNGSLPPLVVKFMRVSEESKVPGFPYKEGETENIENSMRVLVSGGGTGGHIYPALAVAMQLREKYQAEILFLGSDDGLETEIVPAAGFRLATVKAGKLRRYISWQTITGVIRVPLGMIQAINIVGKFRPGLVFTSGGYVAVPAGLAARFNGVPLLMHQQDVPPNLSNRLVAPLATRISVAFADSLAYFPARKTLQMGNPIRQAMLDVGQTQPREARQALGLGGEVPLLLVTGGSQGARHLNQTVGEALPGLLAECQVLQISGRELYNETRALTERVLAEQDEALRERYRLVTYLNEEMPLALQAADLVLCRSGASTLSELAVLGKPSVLVPLPPAIGSSPQEANAEMFGRNKAAQVIKDSDLKPRVLIENVKSILASSTLLETMANAARSFAKPDATQEIAAEAVKIAKVRK
ncbi:MAG TPA: undecaprenyldiphospho-muramoylpentapeptide beta-N-acetylglucosaminyltransferase [Ktedonobacteraceae bacterium]|nr:undecaprenyldiphospho-muramoylpentapeptide beta-N-acetylglucosaminyltransferase [Ktedonobacteraceae bacterium]